MASHKITLGKNLELPIDVITMRSLVLGVSGSGKSTFGRLLAEKIHEAGQRFCVIDLKNDWWGLKSSADGKHAAIPVVIFGGPRADIPLDEHAGAAVADIVAETPHSFVVDLDELSKGKGIWFLGAFLERLYDVNRQPLLLICDEADRYAPQKPMSVEANVTLGAADDIARRGRKRGIGSLWLSQRPAVIAKNVTSQCELVVTFRTSSSLDLKELKEHIGRVASAEQVTETMRQVAGLQDGQAILMSQHPHLRMFKTVQFPMPATFDSSATPRVGQRRVEPKLLAAPDLAALGERIRTAAEKAKASDPKHLQARVRELELQLKKADARAPEVERVNVPVLGDDEIVKLRGLVSGLDVAGKRACEHAALMLDAIGRAVAARGAPIPLQRRDPAPRHTNSAAVPRQPMLRQVSERDQLPKGERAVLIACAQYPDGVKRDQLTILTGYKRSTRDAYVQRLREREFVEDHHGDIIATPAGVEALGSDFEPLPTGEALREHWLRRLPEGERRVLEALIQHYPQAVERSRLEEQIGYQRSTRDAYLQRLASRRLVVQVGRGEVRASEELFEA